MIDGSWTLVILALTEKGQRQFVFHKKLTKDFSAYLKISKSKWKNQSSLKSVMVAEHFVVEMKTRN